MGRRLRPLNHGFFYYIMFNRNNLTDFEKLLFAESYIKKLKNYIKSLHFERGVRITEIQELKYLINKNPDLQKQLSIRKNLSSLSKKYEKLKKQNNELIKNNKELNWELIQLKRNINLK